MCKLEDQIKCIRTEIHNLRVKLSEKVLHLRELEEQLHDADEPLAGGVIERYSRQLLLPGMEIRGQQRLMSTTFLIVGMGGLGCPAAQYLVAAGCGAVSLVDYDTVELNNLHRQVLHTEKRVGWHKVDSAAHALSKMNSKCKIKCYRTALDSKNALEIIRQHDVVLDCSDNVATRYLLNDACVLARKPLVSGSALQWEGQLTVFNYKNGPCYRCIFPRPPPPETVNNCSDGGVLGAVTGTIGSLQALEAIKIAIDAPSVLSQRMLIFDGMDTLIRTIKLRPRVPTCAVCSPQDATIKELIDYEQFCGAPAKEKNLDLKLLHDSERHTVTAYYGMQHSPHLLLDVRPQLEFQICQLPGSVNVPIDKVLDNSYLDNLPSDILDQEQCIVVVCRRGNDSQKAVQHLRTRHPEHSIRDIIGGLHAWHNEIDRTFPIY